MPLNQHEAEESRTELSRIVESALGRPLDADKFEGLFQIQTELRAKQQQLVVELDTNAITSHAYMERINNLLSVAMEANRALLGEEVFKAIYGEAGYHPEGMIESNRFYFDIDFERAQAKMPNYPGLVLKQ